MIKIATYNIHYGHKRELILQNIQTLASQGVGIFCLQEVSSIKGKISMGDDIMGSLGLGWQMELFTEPGDIPSIALGLAIIWKSSIFELKNIDKLFLPKLQKLELADYIFQKFGRANIEQGSILKIFSKKVRPQILQRGALIADFNFEYQLLRICNLHLDYGGGIKQRLLQTEYLNRHLKNKTQVSRSIICGDFNTTGTIRNSKIQALAIKHALNDEFKDTLPQPYSTLAFFQRTDYILQKGFDHTHCKVFHVKGSDHWPLVATLE